MSMGDGTNEVAVGTVAVGATVAGAVGFTTGYPWVRFSHTTPVPVYTITHCG